MRKFLSPLLLTQPALGAHAGPQEGKHKNRNTMQSTEAKPGSTWSPMRPVVPDHTSTQQQLLSTTCAALHPDSVTQVAERTMLVVDNSQVSHTLSASSFVPAYDLPPLPLLPPPMQGAEVTNSHGQTQRPHEVAGRPLASHSSPATVLGVATPSPPLSLPPKQSSSAATDKTSPTADFALAAPLLPPPKPKQPSPAAIAKLSPALISAPLARLVLPVPSVTRLLDSISSTAPDVTHVDRTVSLPSKSSSGSSTPLSALLSIPESSSISNIGLASVIGSPVISTARHKKAAESADASSRQLVPEQPDAAGLTDGIRLNAADRSMKSGVKPRQSSSTRNAKRTEADHQAQLLQQWEARAQQLFVSVSKAARRSGLTRGVVDGWVSANLVKHLKTGNNNAMRLCDVSDVLRLRDQKVAPSMPRSLEPDSRSLLYTRIGPSERPGWQEEDLSDEVERLSEELSLQLAQTHPALADWEPLKSTEIAESGDLDRPGFVRIMALILGREINNLVVSDVQQLCSADCAPLLQWICSQNHVTLVQIRPSVTAQ